MNKLQSIITTNLGDFINNHSLSFQQIKALNSIASCQTSNMGSHTLTCECGHEKTVHNSCYNRHCPICGNFKKELWIQKQQACVIPTHYFHLVFTVPSELRTLIQYNQKILYNVMYHATSRTIIESSEEHLGVTPGFTLILHTWSQNLSFHPHLHCILAGGGLSADQTYFQSFKKKFFRPVKALSAVYKAKFLEELKLLYTDEKLVFPKDLKSLEDAKTFQLVIDNLFKRDWVVFSKRAFKSASHVINYLGRYTHKVAIYDRRIKRFNKNSVTFSYRDRKNNNKEKEMTLTREEFMRRFLLHVLPHKFTKIRHYGFLSNRLRHIKVCLIRKLIAKQRGLVMPVQKAQSKEDLLLKLVGEERLRCPECGCLFNYTYDVCLE